MRVDLWNPNKFDESFEHVTTERLYEAGKLIRDRVKARTPVGTVTRPIYRTGRYAGQPWTMRDAGMLRRSIRVTRMLSKSGTPLKRKRSIRVYAGHYLAYYARIVEHDKAFMRPAYQSAISEVKQIIGAR